MVLGNCSSKTRGWMSSVNCSAPTLLTIRALSRMARGVSHNDAAPVTSVASSANVSTGAITARLDTPAARMAVISPSVDMRPRPMRIPTSTPNGTVSGSTGGRASVNSHSTVAVCVELRTSNSKSLSTCCRKMTKVASSVPSSALETISRKTYRVRMRIPIDQCMASSGLAFFAADESYGSLGRARRWHLQFFDFVNEHGQDRAMLFLRGLQLFHAGREVFVRCQNPPQPHEGAHICDTNAGGPLALDNRRKHG